MLSKTCMKLFICVLVCTLAKADLMSATCGALLGLLPSQLYDPLAIPGGCGVNACGTSSGSGYYDIACNVFCNAALYSSGTCSLFAAGPPMLGTCICNAPDTFLSQSLLLSPLVCDAIGACICGSCGFVNGAICTVVPNGINITCSV